MRLVSALLLMLTSLISSSVAGAGHGTMLGALLALAVQSCEATALVPLPNENGINPEGDNPQGDNPLGDNPMGDNPMGTAPCGTYATTATDGPCGAWFTAIYSITPEPLPETTLTTVTTTTVVVEAIQTE
ncbi:MAG: hypothetical protein L6R40_001560 [Gallowayella cf. fulva]|nr:MAG: hypothetical protein L6R40_001560 [Xanthomendoza cf. fulva]